MPSGNALRVVPGADEGDLAEEALADDLGRLLEVEVGALPEPHLDDPLVLPGGGEHRLALLDRHRDRLLDEDVLPRLAGHDHRQGVPVVRCGVDDDVDRLVVEEPSEVGVDDRAFAGLGLALLEVRREHVAHGGDLGAVGLERLQVGDPLPSRADDAHPHAVVGPEGLARQRPGQGHAHDGARAGGAVHEGSAVDGLAHGRPPARTLSPRGGRVNPLDGSSRRRVHGAGGGPRFGLAGSRSTRVRFPHPGPARDGTRSRRRT